MNASAPDQFRLSDAERVRFRPLARRILRAVESDQAHDLYPLRLGCMHAGYVWGDLFLQACDMGIRYAAAGDEKSLRRVAELRADLRAFVTDDACLDDDDIGKGRP